MFCLKFSLVNYIWLLFYQINCFVSCFIHKSTVFSIKRWYINFYILFFYRKSKSFHTNFTTSVIVPESKYESDHKNDEDTNGLTKEPREYEMAMNKTSGKSLTSVAMNNIQEQPLYECIEVSIILYQLDIGVLVEVTLTKEKASNVLN